MVLLSTSIGEIMIPTIEQLRKLSSQIQHNVPDVNLGGCCVVAVEIAQHLRNKFPTKIRVSNSWGTHDDTPLELIAEAVDDIDDLYCWMENGVGMGHVFVEFEHNGRSYYMDSTGVHAASGRDPAFRWPLYAGQLPLDVAKRLADYGDWNHTFNRSYVPRIRAYVNNFFKQYA